VDRPIVVAVAGAGGQIGYALIFRIAAGGLFGPDQPVVLSLLETPGNLPVLRAHEKELRDCGFPALAGVRIDDDPLRAFDRADWVILLGGRPRTREGQKRTELLRENGPTFVEQGRAINSASPSARVLVVANPCNTNCLIAMTHAPDVPVGRWFAMNHLDRMRAASLIAEKAGVAASEVNRLTVWGNHSDSAYIDFHNAFIGERPAPEVINDPSWVRDVLEPTVGNRSSEIISLRGGTPAASASQAILATIRSATIPTPYHRRFGASVPSDGSYGVPRGLVFGFPLRTEDGVNWSIVQGLYLDSQAQARIAANVSELEFEAAAVTDLLGGQG